MRLLTRLFQSTQKSEAVRQSAIVGLGSLLSSLIMIPTIILASRILGPEKFGVLSVGIAFAAILGKGIDLGLDQLFPKLMNAWENDVAKAREFLSHMIFWKLRVAAVVLIVGLLGIPAWMRVLNYPYPSMLVFTILGAICLSLYEHVISVLRGRHEFVWSVALNLSQTILKAIGFLLIFLLSSDHLVPIAAIYFLAPGIGAIAISYFWKQWIYLSPKLSTGAVKKAVYRFAPHMSMGALAYILLNNIDVLLVQRYMSSFDTGIYSGASRITMLITFMGLSVSGVLANRVARYKGSVLLKKYLLKSTLVVLLSGLGFILFLPFAELAIRFSIGPAYLPGLNALIVLVGNAFLGVALLPYLAFFLAVDEPWFFSLGGVLQVLVVLVGTWWFLPAHGLMAVAFSRLFATTFFAGYTIFMIHRTLQRTTLLESEKVR